MEGHAMETARIFTNGGSQAVRLPKEFRFNQPDVYVKKIGSIVILIPKNLDKRLWWDSFITASDDFMNERVQPPRQAREAL